MLEQILISTLSLTSLGFAYWPHRDLRRYGALCGLAAQPVWLYLVVSQAMWGLLPLTFAFSAVYVSALYAHWSKKVADHA